MLTKDPKHPHDPVPYPSHDHEFGDCDDSYFYGRPTPSYPPRQPHPICHRPFAVPPKYRTPPPPSCCPRTDGTLRVRPDQALLNAAETAAFLAAFDQLRLNGALGPMVDIHGDSPHNTHSNQVFEPDTRSTVAMGYKYG